MRAGGSHRVARRFILSQFRRLRWLRRRSALNQRLVSGPNGQASPAPTNGQVEFDRSLNPHPSNPDAFRRYGVDFENQEAVVLDRHKFVTDESGAVIHEGCHGHAQAFRSIPETIRMQMVKHGWITKKGIVLPK